MFNGVNNTGDNTIWRPTACVTSSCSWLRAVPLPVESPVVGIGTLAMGLFGIGSLATGLFGLCPLVTGLLGLCPLVTGQLGVGPVATGRLGLCPLVGLFGVELLGVGMFGRPLADACCGALRRESTALRNSSIAFVFSRHCVFNSLSSTDETGDFGDDTIASWGSFALVSASFSIAFA